MERNRCLAIAEKRERARVKSARKYAERSKGSDKDEVMEAYEKGWEDCLSYLGGLPWDEDMVGIGWRKDDGKD